MQSYTRFDPMRNKNNFKRNHVREVNKLVRIWILLFVICLGQYKAYNFAFAELRLSASGGGWRAMFTNLGFFNAFKSAGIIDIENQTTLFTGISSNSGASWFLGQVAFSRPFLNMALPNNPNAVYNFTLDWIAGYQDFFSEVEKSNEPKIKACNLLSSFEETKSYCQLLLYEQFTWGKYIEDMFQSTASNTHGDTDITSRELTSGKRLTLFKDTDLMFQTSLSPVSKVEDNRQRFGKRSGHKQFLSYVGPNHMNKSVFSALISCQYTITAHNAAYRYAVEPSMMPLRVYTGTAPRQFKFSDWENYALYRDGFTSSIVTDLPDSEYIRSSAISMKKPFRDGVGTFKQVIGASSAFLSDITSAMPSLYAQKNSFDKFLIENSTKTNLEKRRDVIKLERRLNIVYKLNFINDLAVCSNWPKKCAKGNVRLIDGGYTDGASLAMNIGLHQSQNPNFQNETMKVILINSNKIDDSPVNLLGYFSTYYNQGITPGDWIWGPLFNGELAKLVPSQSMQICQEYVDVNILNASLTPVSSVSYQYWNVTTGILNCTTVENRPFGVKAGQKIQIFLARINSQIPTFIISPSDVDKFKVPLAKQTQYIATEPELVNRLKAFVSI